MVAGGGGALWDGNQCDLVALAWQSVVQVISHRRPFLGSQAMTSPGTRASCKWATRHKTGAVLGRALTVQRQVHVFLSAGEFQVCGSDPSQFKKPCSA